MTPGEMADWIRTCMAAGGGPHGNHAAAAAMLEEAKRLLEKAQPPYFHQDEWHRARYAWLAGDVGTFPSGPSLDAIVESIKEQRASGRPPDGMLRP